MYDMTNTKETGDERDGVAGKLRIPAGAAKYDVSCSSSGSSRPNTGGIGNAQPSGICHAWTADGRCVSLLSAVHQSMFALTALIVPAAAAEGERAAFRPMNWRAYHGVLPAQLY